jgi:hypothetical protein
LSTIEDEQYEDDNQHMVDATWVDLMKKVLSVSLPFY